MTTSESTGTMSGWRERLWNPYVVVFISSASIMVIELVASRLVAPVIGVSLYTWTSVIGIILAGISLGNYIGGRLADRYASPSFLGIMFALASLGSLSTLWLIDAMQGLQALSNLPLMVWIVSYIAAVFFVPSAVLGCISPIVVKLTLTDLGRTGLTVGKIYAWSTAGSIVGTFATGFFLISWFGTRMIILLVAAVLMLMALWFLTLGSRGRALARGTAVVLLFALAAGLLSRGGLLSSRCVRESNYFCIKVNEKEMEGRIIRELVLDRLVHSYVDMDDPAHLVYGYERTYAEVVRPVVETRPQLEALFIGGGGYSFPRYLEVQAPQSRVVVAEIDPEVTEIAHELLGLDRDTRMELFSLDARLLLTRLDQPNTYDLVFGDAFNDYSVPFHLTTVEFNRIVDRLLRDDGLYVVNIIDSGVHGHFLRAYVNTLQEVFAHVAVVPMGTGWQKFGRTTFIIVAGQQPADLTHLPRNQQPVSQDELAAYLAMDPPLVLTDDFVPVDNLLSPVFEDSGRS
jgi:spermidine synthase